MSPAVLTILLAFVIIQKADSAGLKGSELIIDRIIGPPPTKSRYLSEDSGAKLRRVNRKAAPGLFLFLNVTRVLPNSTMLIVKLYEGHNNAYKSVLIDYKLSFCEYLANEHRPIVSAMKDVLKLPRRCPVEPAVFKIDNWQLSQYMPPMLPISEAFKITGTVNFERQDSIVLTVFFRVGPK